MSGDVEPTYSIMDGCIMNGSLTKELIILIRLKWIPILAISHQGQASPSKTYQQATIVRNRRAR